MNVTRAIRIYDVLSALKERLERRLTYICARPAGLGNREEMAALRAVLAPLDDRILYLGRLSGIERSRDQEIELLVWGASMLAAAQDFAPGVSGSVSLSGVRHTYYSDKGMVTIEGREAI